MGRQDAHAAEEEHEVMAPEKNAFIAFQRRDQIRDKIFRGGGGGGGGGGRSLVPDINVVENSHGGAEKVDDGEQKSAHLKRREMAL